MKGNAVRLEFYNVDAEDPNRALVAAVASYAVPDVGETVSIRGVTYEVVGRTWCVDRADGALLKVVRANVDIREVR